MLVVTDPLNQSIYNKVKNLQTSVDNKPTSYNATAGNASTVSGPAYVKSIHGSGYCAIDTLNGVANSAFEVGYSFGGVSHVLSQGKTQDANTSGPSNASVSDSKSLVFPDRGLYIPSGDTLTLNSTATTSGTAYANADISALYSTSV
jgi:hypothetical protein